MRRFPPRVLIPLLLALSLFATLAVGQELGALGWLDEPVLDAFEALRGPTATPWVCAVTHLGGGWVLTGVVVVAAVALWWRHRQVATYLAVTGIGSAVLSPLLKLAFARPRPDAALRLSQASSYAFPSGHSFGSAVVYGAVAVAVWACARRLAGPVTAGCVVLVLAIGLSRVALRVHYPSDVLAGWSLGAFWSVALGRLLLVNWGTMARPGNGQERDRE